MDEVRMVRDSYPEPAPPSAEEIAQVKAMLNAPPRRSLPRLRWGLGGGLVAVGAAATVAITLTGGNGPSRVPLPGQIDLDARGAVLAAAQKAEQQPTGKYWSVDTVAGQSYVIRAKTGTYAITGAADETFSWHGAKVGMGEAYYGRDLPAHPLTREDVALWRKAGSPSTFRVPGDGRTNTYTTRVAKWRSSGPEVGANPRGGGDFLGKSAEELQNLPTDPAKLAELFLNQNEMSKATGLSAKRALAKDVQASAKLFRISGLLRTPLPPKVRAGLMRALAAQPGIHAIGRATDPLGRTGVALASGERVVTVTGEFGTPKIEQGTYRSREVIIFDERTGALLSRQDTLTKPGGRYAEMKPGFVIEYQANRSAGWTDTKPKPPTELPFGRILGPGW
ncbi:CU044_5270 family protein [Actinomadura fulvescens]|uniref:CU044_5270 family protein n=1 Tax=Actinomadura fulvescens TaxID=46160 RepID=A0ABP6CZD1_9ACTN